jgi:hypothetical protein
MHAPRSFVVLSLLACSLLLTACDLLGLEPASAMAARKEAEGRAIGGACRHAGRAIEDCYTLNRRAYALNPMSLAMPKPLTSVN